jgi:hypothetical protein
VTDDLEPGADAQGRPGSLQKTIAERFRACQDTLRAGFDLRLVDDKLGNRFAGAGREGLRQLMSDLFHEGVLSYIAAVGDDASEIGTPPGADETARGMRLCSNRTVLMGGLPTFVGAVSRTAVDCRVAPFVIRLPLSVLVDRALLEDLEPRPHRYYWSRWKADRALSR